MTPRVLMLFVDGLGLGERDPAFNPVYSGACPCLAAWLDGVGCVAADACLGVDGVPQSATGQTALLTGINAPRLLGRHVEGFPGPALRSVIETHNIFGRLSAAGLSSTFANGYLAADVAAVRRARVKSVTTVAALSGLGTVRTREFIERNEAVCHDLTRDTLSERGYAGPTIRAEDAGRHMLAIAARQDFTLFEYFLTDRAGHRGDHAGAAAVLARFDRFLESVLAGADGCGLTVVLTSDHGNIEDLRTGGHTRNPVPFAVSGPLGGRLAEQVRTLTDVTPALLGGLTGH